MIYYIASNGNDSFGGTAMNTAWRTINKLQQALDNDIIQPGDQIKFRCGDSFTGKLIWSTIWGYTHVSGTSIAPITITSYTDPANGSTAKPKFFYPTSLPGEASGRILFWIVGVNYINFNNLEFTDNANDPTDKATPANLGTPIKFGSDGEAQCHHCTVRNCRITFCGMGVIFIGDFNIMEFNVLMNFKNLTSTATPTTEDVGATAFTLTGDNNQILSNYVEGAWAESIDFGWNGGCIEMYNQSSNNIIKYNTFVDCGGVSEYGASNGGNGLPALGNIMAYNKVINCGCAIYCNIGGEFAMQVGGLKVYNNVFIETTDSRFSAGPNFGAGLVTPAVIASANANGVDDALFATNITPAASLWLDLQNNYIQLTNNMNVVRSHLRSRTNHQYNVYKFSGGADTNYSEDIPHVDGVIDPTELITTANVNTIFEDVTNSNPALWNFHPKTGSPLLDFGHNVGELLDFFRPEDFGIQPHIAVLGAFGLELFKARLIVGQRDAADMVEAAGHAGDFFQLFVKPDGIALQGGHIGIAVQRMKAACRVPGRAGGQFRAFNQHHVGPAKLGQVVQHRTADDTAANYHHAGMGFHMGDSLDLHLDAEWRAGQGVACGFATNCVANRI